VDKDEAKPVTGTSGGSVSPRRGGVDVSNAALGAALGLYGQTTKGPS
jgi:hypothetical protein